MSYDVKLPRLAATRETAADLLAAQLPGDLDESTVRVFGRLVSSSTASFADELLRLLHERHASEIVLIGVPDTFKTDAHTVAERRKLNVRDGSEADLYA
jgi:hypothetical protein